jgi:hypothetical protein
MLHRSFFFFLSLLLTATAFAQSTGTLTGIVTDAQGKGIAAATVSLLKSTDSALVKTAVSDKNGAYEFVNIKEGSYLISITSVGYLKKLSAPLAVTADKSVTVPGIALESGATAMKEVTVQAKRPFIETKIDKTIVNVEASPTNAGATALDVLEKSPGVMVNSDGAISLRGKQGVIVMLDGKPTYLSATDLANMLKNMPATALDQIEIMTNPSSKYDASGNSGIINIKTKKGKNDGFNGSITLGATTSIYKPEKTLYFMPKSQNSFNFNYRKGKWNFFGNYNPNMFRGRSLQVLHRSNFDPNTKELVSYTDQDIRFKFGNENQTLKLGADWFLDKKNTLGVVVSGFKFVGRPTPTTTANITDLQGNLLSRMVSHTTNRVAFKNGTANLNWRHVFDSAGKELTADADVLTYQNTTNMLLETVPYNGIGESGATIYLKGHVPSNINIYSFKSDYVQPFKKGRLEAGIKSSYVKTDNVVDYRMLLDDKWEPDARSNHFIYDENINAAYVNVNRQFGKWTVQGGLRVENTIAHGDQVTTQQTFKRDTTNLFPSAFISYDINKANKLTAAYSKRITRPSYQNLNPFIFFADSLTFFRGNPLLRPQYTHNMELTYSLKSKYIATLAFNNTSNVIAQIIKPDGVKMFNTFENVAKLNNVSLSLTIPVTVAKWWNANVFGTVYSNHYTGIYNSSPVDIEMTSFMTNMTNTFTFSKTLTGEISGFYRFRGIDGFAVLRSIYQMSVAVQKQVLKSKGTVRLNLRDPFAWQRFRGYTRLDGIDMTFDNRPDLRQLTATFTYRFGKTTQQNQPRRRTSGSQEEQSRVGQGG